MKIMFISDDNFPWNKILKFHNLTIVVRSVFQEDGKYYSKPKKVQVSKLNKFYSDKKNSTIIKNTLCEQQK